MTKERKEYLIFIGLCIAEEEEKEGKQTGLRQWCEYCKTIDPAILGGYWDDGAYAGLFLWLLYSSSGYSRRFIGARLLENVLPKIKEYEKQQEELSEKNNC